MYFGSQMYIRSQIYFNFASYQKWFSPHFKLIGSKFASDPIFLIILFLSAGHTWQGLMEGKFYGWQVQRPIEVFGRQWISNSCQINFQREILRFLQHCCYNFSRCPMTWHAWNLPQECHSWRMVFDISGWCHMTGAFDISRVPSDWC